ncbi:MAG: hypothetical protein GWN00_27475, partial [Aliifodinibius sp.]|nr:hypothetical protein [Fodinibius sp.]NIX01433.1 hypothetical protein [Phycisphaerae bacterium]NIY28408.1 hypothetical protein [Fodinibius sp.]
TIDWGRAENLLWIGKAYKQKNEPGKAENYFSTALDRYPGYRWAKHELNELEKVASV